jgi:DNA repair protein RecN (Recombination protein N)
LERFLLNELLIKNFAIIDNVSISFNNGLTILSGETGAGKSIVINAVNLILGGRANTEIIRTGEEKASVEASFSIEKCQLIKEKLLNHGFENESELIIKRVISKSGKNKIYINDSLASLSTLQEISTGLIELTAQHEHQSLQNPENHIFFLDNFGRLESKVKNYHEKFLDLKNLISEKSRLETSSREEASKRDYIKFELNEINSINPKFNEDRDLEEKRSLLVNLVNIQNYTNESFNDLYETEESALNKISIAKSCIEKLSKLDPKTNSLLTQAEQVFLELEDLCLALRDYKNKLTQNDDDIDFIEERLFKINGLKRKYGPEIKDVLNKKKEFEEKLNLYENFEELLAEINKKIKNKFSEVFLLAKDLSYERKKTAKKLSTRLEKELKDLAMEKTKFVVDFSLLGQMPSESSSISFSSLPLNDMGMDNIEFLCSTNIGEDVKPLIKIASGGELSRFILAFKNIISSRQNTSIYVFDEVDSGISGAQAQIVGQKIKSVSKNSQVICITHLPQIASLGDTHIHIEKVEKNGRTFVKVKTLNKDERILEISRMLGGIKISKSARDHAKSLIEASI